MFREGVAGEDECIPILEAAARVLIATLDHVRQLCDRLLLNVKYLSLF